MGGADKDRYAGDPTEEGACGGGEHSSERYLDKQRGAGAAGASSAGAGAVKAVLPDNCAGGRWGQAGEDIPF
ncbi:uncharacterized protein MONOS_9962 [Monocercomonoides exilis]|uniref:uncharacterized protein n=1 Tax=Monocercomonoides exilis TaxID=2049356 RepID=UPI00355A5B9B|nr:hypothetical protein MONOS_9962 [Monocercomonoides exilis]|eukprot:MONOS_9962.1-p1 / transcript=MONOS_9962.1 / gene=MONOS_9962 / organism=Monocercomonoides_exilis_PA203 / gene_product=unspecified product / transcript_product=unspecified product / location=Mono_scaffold00432:4673-4980(+) / protein_length=72 / sequence_SO=supercontig / SO=protein_coding / is_pseudo=false